MRWWYSTLLLLAFPLGPLAGQSPPDRLDLDRFRDSLETSDSPAALVALRHGLARRHPSDPLTSLRAALVALRLTALGRDPGAGLARSELRRLVEQRPDWPYAWHLLAVATLHRAEWERADRLALGNRVGTGTVERSLEYEHRALAADPTFIEAALALAETALALHDTAFYAPARDALRRTVHAVAAPPADLLLAHGRLERAAGDADSATAAFARAAVPRSGTPASLARLELARTSLAAGGGGGDSAYFHGVVNADSTLVAAYRADLAPIATEAELARYDRARGSERATFLEEFWTRRDRVELRRPGERVREHYRRLLYARRHFALTVFRRFYGGRDAYRSGSGELDDRGVIYVRHGEPAARLRPFVFGLMPNETWRYDRADGDLLLHFSAGYDEAGGGDLYDYRLVESVLDLHGAAGAPVDQLLLSRETLSPVYGRMLHWGPNGAARARGRERGIGRASIEYGTNTDTHELQYARRLTAYANLVAVGRRDGLPLAHFVFAIGSAGTTPARTEGGVIYPVRVRLVTLDGSERALAEADTTVEFRLDGPLARGQYLIGRVELPVPAGQWVWRAAIEHGPDAGIVLPRDTVRVVPAAPALSLSDLALGVRGASARWPAAPADTVLLTPFDLFVEGSDLELYYEATGAAVGAPYRHEIAVFRVRGNPARVDERPVVTLAFEEPADADVIRAHRTLRLRRFKPGRYVVEVKVAGGEGRVETRRRGFQVVKQEK